MNYIKFLCKAFNLKMFYSRCSYADTVFIFTFVNPLTDETTYYHADADDLRMLDYTHHHWDRDRKAGVSQSTRYQRMQNCWWEREYLFTKLNNIA